MVPKSEATDSFEAFRPISTLQQTTNFINKVITKLLANRLSSIIGKIISPKQSAFIQGRGIVEKILLAHELMQKFIIESDTSKLCAKVDLEKMDSINRTSPSLCRSRILQKEVYCLKVFFSYIFGSMQWYALRLLWQWTGYSPTIPYFSFCSSVLRWKASPFLFKRGNDNCFRKPPPGSKSDLSLLIRRRSNFLC